MISYIKGKIIFQDSEYIIAETQSIGYKVRVAGNKLSLYPVGREVELWCHLHMKREETLELFGVESPEALAMFETLNNISGIGPRAALELASLGTMEQLKEAIDKGDASYFKVPGIGQKKIQKIILELTGKLKRLNNEAKPTPQAKEAIEALVALGFPKTKAREAVSQLPDRLSSEQKVKEALKAMKS